VKVLFIHQHFNTPQQGGALRSYYLAKSLVDRGVAVSVITGANTKTFKRETIDGIEVHYLPVAYFNRFGFLNRIRSYANYLISAARHAKKINDVNLCYVISTPLTTGLVGIWLKRKYGIPYIFEVGDLWPDAPIQLGYVKNPVLKAIFYEVEKKIYLHAHSIVALSPMIQKEIERKAPGKKTFIVTNMSDVEFFRNESKRGDLVQKFNAGDSFVISYVGTLGVANGLDYLIDCARACQLANLCVKFIVCGEGAVLIALKDAALRLKLQNIQFIPFQNREGVRDLMNISDAIFVSYKNVPVLETGSPNKYFDGLAAAKLIIINFGGWIKDELEKEQCGVSLDPRHPAEIVNKITPFLNDSRLLIQFQLRARQLAEVKYAREILGDYFFNVINNATARN